MDKNRFDGFTRQLAHRESRRQAIKTLFAGGLGTAAAVVVGTEAEAAKTDCCPVDRPKLCNFTCTDTIYDEQNCGTCGNICDAGENCYKGVCEDPSIVHCATVTDCPGSNTECSTRTCKQGVCGLTFAVNGKKTTTQTAGDCQRNVCDGAGNIITIVDNTDKPAAQSECTTGICVDGVPHQNMRPAGRTCSTGKCDGAGQCSGGGCTSASTCPGTDTECRTRTCTNGVCGFQNTPSGTETSQQTTGDCQQIVCDGNGGTTSTPDNTDTPPQPDFGYGVGCVESSCNNGTPVQSNKPVGAECSDDFGNSICDGAGNCVGCLVDTDCPDLGVGNAAPSCSGGFCSYTCLAGWGDCLPDGIGGCETNILSSDLHCGACNNPCPSGQSCTNGQCAGCLISSDCPGLDDECQYRTCTNGNCGMSFASYGTPTSSQTPGDCRTNVCDGNGSVTSVIDDTDFTPPYYGNPCADSICTGGVPSNPSLSAGTPCIGGGGVCNGSGACVMCVGPSDCSSNGIGQASPICVNGFCSYTCFAGWGDCQSGPGGCETDLQNDDNHCGLCHQPCPSGQHCDGGICV